MKILRIFLLISFLFLFTFDTRSSVLDLKEKAKVATEAGKEVTTIFERLGAVHSIILVVLSLVSMPIVMVVLLSGYSRYMEIKNKYKNGDNQIVELFKEQLNDIFTKLNDLTIHVHRIEERLKALEKQK